MTKLKLGFGIAHICHDRRLCTFGQASVLFAKRTQNFGLFLSLFANFGYLTHFLEHILQDKIVRWSTKVDKHGLCWSGRHCQSKIFSNKFQTNVGLIWNFCYWFHFFSQLGVYYLRYSINNSKPPSLPGPGLLLLLIRFLALLPKNWPKPIFYRLLFSCPLILKDSQKLFCKLVAQDLSLNPGIRLFSHFHFLSKCILNAAPFCSSERQNLLEWKPRNSPSLSTAYPWQALKLGNKMLKRKQHLWQYTNYGKNLIM